MSYVGPSRPSRPRIAGYTKASGSLHVVADWREAYGNNWQELREACLRRDNYTCQNKGCCAYYPPPQQWRLQAHHIMPLSLTGPRGNNLANLRTLCKDCHKLTHGRM